MKKTLLLLFASVGTMFTLSAQTILYDNGPLINAPGGGFGGADLSHLHSGLTTWGAGHAVSSGYRVADEFMVPVGESWTIDSIVFFAYQTSSGLTSTINEVNFAIWDGTPGESGSNIIYGDTMTNKLISTAWSNIYRTNSTDFMNTDRPVMRNVASSSGLVLQAGTYWVDWQTGGTTTSGPWAPEITISNQPATGNALQYNPTTQLYTSLLDNNQPQGMPFILIGSSITSVSEIYNNGNVSVYPNPFSTYTIIEIDTRVFNSNTNLSIVITNALGQQMHQITEINSGNLKLDRNNLDNGIYFYELRNNNKIISVGKLVIN